MDNIQSLLQLTQKASHKLSLIELETVNAVLMALAEKAVLNASFIIEENKKDLIKMDQSDPKYDRLVLTEGRIENIAAEMRQIASLESPLNKILEHKTLPNGLDLTKVSVPMGVIGIIYEARPNVTFDCFALCFKSGNAVVLKGGSDAEYSNTAIIKLIHQVLSAFNIDINIAQLLPSGRAATSEMLNAVGYIDMLIPRGSQSLIDYVRQNAKVPVIETGAGIVHLYFDKDGDLEKGANIINNAKTRRVSVCNALDCLLIHTERVKDLPALVNRLKESKVILYVDPLSYQSLEGNYPPELLQHATEASFGTEFLDYKMAIKAVDDIEETLSHIEKYSSKHSEAIVSENIAMSQLFFKRVDAAAVYANASPAFTDGAQFGMGAEIGISTQKMHARGPMALPELTTYKWLINGNGQVRN